MPATLTIGTILSVCRSPVVVVVETEGDGEGRKGMAIEATTNKKQTREETQRGGGAQEIAGRGLALVNGDVYVFLWKFWRKEKAARQLVLT
jgi:hypothetical protein